VTLAVVPLTAETGAVAPRFAHDLRDALARHGRAALITALIASDSGTRLEIVDAHERDHDHVVLLAELPSSRDAWTQLCLRHADRVLALTSGGPVPNWVFWHPQLRSCDLVFVDRGDAIGVHEWTKALVPKRRFRVEDGTGWRAGVEAAARRLAGRSTGVVLSGGGARGFAHIGVLEELLSAGLTIDRVGGASCGAWIGAMFALGMDPDEIDARCYEDWVRRNPLTDYTFPRTAMIRGQRVRAVFERNLPGLIEELPRDYFCVSCDLVSGELIVHREGALDVAAAASQCLPGLAPPVALDGRLLIDGGVLNNLPVDVMAATREGPVIAIDVTTRYRPPTSGGQRSPRLQRKRDMGHPHAAAQRAGDDRPGARARERRHGAGGPRTRRHPCPAGETTNAECRSTDGLRGTPAAPAPARSEVVTPDSRCAWAPPSADAELVAVEGSDLQAPGRVDGRDDVGLCRIPGRSDRLWRWS
jgi:NTE family protein